MLSESALKKIEATGGKVVTIDYQPHPKQVLFHASDADECVYGGAKGGGKSCALTMDAVNYALHFPGA